MPTRVIIMGAAGRDFHNFNTVFREDASSRVVAFTATQIPNIEGRRYPKELAGELYPEGIPIHPESDLPRLIRELEASRYEPVKLMEILTQAVIEKRMWFTKMETKAGSVSLSGIAMDDKTVADFMLRLEGCGLFSAVSLRNIKHVELQKTALKSFEIICTKKPVEKEVNPASLTLGAKK